MDGELFLVLSLAIVLVGAAVAAMAIGVMFRRQCLKGSCGGPLACDGCPRKAREARRVGLS
jgi:hypothetical protein